MEKLLHRSLKSIKGFIQKGTKSRLEKVTASSKERVFEQTSKICFKILQVSYNEKKELKYMDQCRRINTLVRVN
jgi:uncharacterized membrane protein